MIEQFFRRQPPDCSMDGLLEWYAYRHRDQFVAFRTCFALMTMPGLCPAQLVVDRVFN